MHQSGWRNGLRPTLNAYIIMRHRFQHDWQRLRHHECHGCHVTHNFTNRLKSCPQLWKLVTNNFQQCVTHWHPFVQLTCHPLTPNIYRQTIFTCSRPPLSVILVTHNFLAVAKPLTIGTVFGRTVELAHVDLGMALRCTLFQRLSVGDALVEF